MNELDSTLLKGPPAIVQQVQDEREDVQPGEVHSREWLPVDQRCIALSKAETVEALRGLDFKKDKYAGLPYFTNGLGLEQVYKKFIEKALKEPNRVTPRVQIDIATIT